MNKKKLLILSLIISVVVVFLYELWQDTTRKESKKEAVVSQTNTERTIEDLERKLSNHQNDVNLYILLANAYLQKIRETADIKLYKKINTLADQAETKDPSNPEIVAIRAQVALGRHDFAKALELGQKAHKFNPEKPLYLGIIADAQIELGYYQQAVESVQKMMDLKPQLSSFVRTAYLRELYGDIEGAEEMFEKAISAGSPYPENIAANLVDLGKLYVRTDLEKAALTFNQALTVYKDYPPALQGLGRSSFAQKDYQKAIEYFEKALDILPIAQYATDLGDVYAKIGEGEKAKRYYFLAKTAYEKAKQSGVNTDLEMALFLADHDMDLHQALEKAEGVYAIRPDNIYAADVLAWALHKNGRSREAQKYISSALYLGEYDPLILFHAGVIAEANNNSEEAKRLFQKVIHLHPYFSIQYAPLLSIL